MQNENRQSKKERSNYESKACNETTIKKKTENKND